MPLREDGFRTFAAGFGNEEPPGKRAKGNSRVPTGKSATCPQGARLMGGGEAGILF